MNAPNFLKSKRNRLLFFGLILSSCVIATIYCIYNESYLEEFLNQFIPTYSKIITVSIPVIVGVLVIGISNEIFSGDLHDWLKDKEPQTLDNIEPVIQHFFEAIEQRYESNLGKQINVSFESDFIDENDGFIRTKEADGIKILPSKKIYGRLNLDDDDWKKEFTVCYPIIEGIESESIL